MHAGREGALEHASVVAHIRSCVRVEGAVALAHGSRSSIAVVDGSGRFLVLLLCLYLLFGGNAVTLRLGFRRRGGFGSLAGHIERGDASDAATNDEWRLVVRARALSHQAAGPASKRASTRLDYRGAMCRESERVRAGKAAGEAAGEAGWIEARRRGGLLTRTLPLARYDVRAATQPALHRCQATRKLRHYSTEIGEGQARGAVQRDRSESRSERAREKCTDEWPRRRVD